MTLRSHRKGALLSLAVLLAAGALGSACGGDDDDAQGVEHQGGKSGGGGGNGGTTIVDVPMGGAGDVEMGGNSSCGESPFKADQLPVSVLLVIDQSGSMVDNEIENGVTRWDAMKDAISAAVEASQGSISYGLELFPASAECSDAIDVTVDVQKGENAAPLMDDALSDADPDGGTPTAAALAAAHEYLTTGAGMDAPGEKFVLLATDGGPNCNQDLTCDEDTCTTNIDDPDRTAICGGSCCEDAPGECLDDDATVDAVKALSDDGIKTIVVGIPGTDAYEDLMSSLATEGGVENPDGPPAYYKVENGSASGLADVLSSITQGLIKSCEFQLTSEPPDSELLNVVIDDERITYDDPNGWRFSDPATHPPTVELLGTTCDAIKEDGAESVTVLYGCAPNDQPK